MNIQHNEKDCEGHRKNRGEWREMAEGKFVLSLLACGFNSWPQDSKP